VVDIGGMNFGNRENVVGNRNIEGRESGSGTVRDVYFSRFFVGGICFGRRSGYINGEIIVRNQIFGDFDCSRHF